MNRPLLLILFAALVVGALYLAWPIGERSTVPIQAPRVDVASRDRGAAWEVAPDRQIAAEVRAGARLLGSVVDAFGEPAAGALVGSTSSERPLACDQDGRFNLPLPGGSADFELLILHEGHAPCVLSEPRPPGAFGDLDLGVLELPRGGRLSGRVVDAQGAPLEHVTVILRSRSVPGWRASFELGELLQPSRTSAEGRFAFADLVSGDYRVEVEAVGYQRARTETVSVRAGAEVVVDDVTMLSGHSLGGVVRDAKTGEPLDGAELSLRNGAGQGYYRDNCRSDADGSFALESLPAGPLRVQITRDGYLARSLDSVDPTNGAPLEVSLEPGLRVLVRAVDARRGEPVEEFAVVARRVGGLDPRSNGTMAQQLDRQLAELGAKLSQATEAADRKRLRHLVEGLQVRRRHVDRLMDARPMVRPGDLPVPSRHPAGAARVDGLDEGLWMIGVVSPRHQYTEQGPVELRLGAPVAELRFALESGPRVHGRVVDARGAAVGDVLVELVELVDEPDSGARAETPLYPWIFAAARPAGITVQRVRTAGDGRFDFAQAAPRRSYLSVRGQQVADHDTEVFVPTVGMPALNIVVRGRATLRGRVLDAPEFGAEVLALGGHGEQRTVAVGRDGRYELRDLQPGGYLLRAYSREDTRYVRRLFAELFPLHAGAVDLDKVPPLDVQLHPGEDRVHDLRFAPTAMGRVVGRVLLNGIPAKRARVVLRPSAGGLSVRGTCDPEGRFAIDDAPARSYRVQVYTSDYQVLHEGELQVIERVTTTLDVDLTAGGVRGSVVAPDVADPTTMSGRVWLLPGASDAPADPYAWRREHRTHRLSLRAGRFEGAALTPGPAIVLVDVRGHPRAVSEVVVPAGGIAEISVTLEPARR